MPGFFAVRFLAFCVSLYFSYRVILDVILW